MSAAHPSQTLPPAISVTAVRRVYDTKPKPVVALDGVDLEVAPGEFFGLLGPNGAGKTTLIKILTTLLLPTSGEARIFGFDVATETKRIRRIMNMVAGGEQSGYGILTVREQLWMFSQFYGLGTREGWTRTDQMIEAVGLHDQRLQRVSTLSTGQRQKLNMARGLLNDPWILFLDEPTLGLDVAAARTIRELVLEWKGAVAGRTVLLTTHYLAEADELCERIAIVDHGRILAIGSPDELKRRVQRESIFRLELDRLDAGAGALARIPGVVSAAPAADADSEMQRVAVNLVLVEDGALGGVVTALAGMGSHILALRKSEPTLEDVFVELVGRGFGDEEPSREPDRPVDDDGPAYLPPMPSADEAEEADRVEAAPMSAVSRRARSRRPRSSPAPAAAPTRGRRRSGPAARSSRTTPRALVGRAFPRVRGMVREPSWVFFEILLPFLTTSAFVLVYRTLQAPEAYVGFVILGGAMAAFWLNVVWMMAAQLYWEKDQGNLELYFAAPMNLMAVLLGMAVGGLIMSTTRAVAILVVSTIVFGVTFNVEQWGLLIAVFLLTMSALYGLGMAMASLYLLWGREAFHMTNVMIEPVYFMSGLNFPVGKLGALGAVAIATIPFAVGLDAMRQLVFAGEPYITGTPSPEIEALILVAMTVAFTLAARWLIRTIERMARGRGSLSIRWQ